MTTCRIAVLLVAAFAAPAAYGQFELYVVDGNVEHPVTAVYNLGSLYISESASAHFRLRNTSTAPNTLTVLEAAGFGFTLSGPALPLSLASQAAADFTVTFRAQDTGSYSAALRSNGISVLLTIVVQPRLTYLVQSGQVASGGSLLALSPAGVNFGTVPLHVAVLRHFVIENRTALALTVPSIAIPAGDFSVRGVPPSGTVLQSGGSSAFDVTFTPTAAGPRTGSLVIGDRTYPLTGVGQDVPLPRPSLSINLQPAASPPQGVATVRFDAPAQSAGTGSLTLEFQAAAQGATDPAVVFASGRRTAEFTISPGDTQSTIAFQTGTTAGTLTFTVQLGTATDSQSLTIAPAVAGVTALQGLRSAGSITVQVTGFDNVRSLGQIAFTFYDSTGKALAPGTIRTDSTKDFAAFFQNTDAGGLFVLRAVFPVTGDVSGITSFDVALTNSVGTTTKSLTLF